MASAASAGSSAFTSPTTVYSARSTTSSAGLPQSSVIIDPHYFILFQHGVLGYAGDFEGVVTDLLVDHEVSLQEAVEEAGARAAGAPSAPDQMGEAALQASKHARRETYKKHFKLTTSYPNNRSGRLYKSGNLVCFAPGVNNFYGTDAGTRTCARRALEEFAPVFRDWLLYVEQSERDRRRAHEALRRQHGNSSANTYMPFQPTPVCFSCVGHSFGGLILREFLYLLLLDTEEIANDDAIFYAEIVSIRQKLRSLRVTFENFVTLATPHCGTSECLWWPIYVGAWFLGKLKLVKTYAELIVTDSERVLQTRLVDQPHLLALRVFRRRVLFANTHRDLLVGFGTGSLIFENVEDDHTKAIGVRPRAAPCAAAFETDASEVSETIYLPPFNGTEEELNYVVGKDKLQCPAPETTVPLSETHTIVDLLNACGGSSRTRRSTVSRAAAQATTSGILHSSTVQGGARAVQHARSRSEASSVSSVGESVSPEFGDEEEDDNDVDSSLDVPDQDNMDDDEDDASYALDEREGNGETKRHVKAGKQKQKRQKPNVTVTVIGSPRKVSCHEQQFPIQQVVMPLSEEDDKGSCVFASGSNLSHVSSLRRVTPSSTTSRRGNGCAMAEDPTSPMMLTAPPLSPCSLKSTPQVLRVSVPEAPIGIFYRTAGRLRAIHRFLTSWKKRDSDDDDDTVAAEGSQNAYGVSTSSRTASCGSTDSCNPYDVLSQGIVSRKVEALPASRVTPRTIAFTLRKQLDWRVRAVRYGNMIPIAHVACLGNWAWAGTSPPIVKAVAEEVAHILV